MFFRAVTEVEFYGSLLVIHDKLRGVISKMQQGAWVPAMQSQGWQSNDSRLLAGTFHHAYLINDSTSPYCPGGELSTRQQLLFSLMLRSHPLCGHRQRCGYEELPQDWCRRSRAAEGLVSASRDLQCLLWICVPSGAGRGSVL